MVIILLALKIYVLSQIIKCSAFQINRSVAFSCNVKANALTTIKAKLNLNVNIKMRLSSGENNNLEVVSRKDDLFTTFIRVLKSKNRNYGTRKKGKRIRLYILDSGTLIAKKQSPRCGTIVPGYMHIYYMNFPYASTKKIRSFIITPFPSRHRPICT